MTLSHEGLTLSSMYLCSSCLYDPGKNRASNRVSRGRLGRRKACHGMSHVPLHSAQHACLGRNVKHYLKPPDGGVSPVFNDTQPAPVKQPLKSSVRLLRGSCSRSLKPRPSTRHARHSVLNREHPHVRAGGIPASLRAYLSSVPARSDPGGW